MDIVTPKWGKKILFRRDSMPVDADSHGLICHLEAYRYLGIGRHSFDKHVRPLVPSYRIGNRVMFKKNELADFADRIARDTASHRRKQR